MKEEEAADLIDHPQVRSSCRAFVSTRASHLKLLLGLELLQRSQRSVLVDPKKQDPRATRCYQTGRRPGVRTRSHTSALFDRTPADLLVIHLRSEVAGEYGSKPLYRMLGYFSIIGLLRVHVLLGDYTLALKMMDEIELSKKVRLVLTLS